MMTSSQPQSKNSQSISKALSPDVLFEILAHERRRHILKCLSECQTPLALADLAREVAAREQGVPITDIPADEVRQVYPSLYHVHIPKLRDADIVEYNQEREVVALSMETEHVKPFVERTMANE